MAGSINSNNLAGLLRTSELRFHHPVEDSGVPFPEELREKDTVVRTQLTTDGYFFIGSDPKLGQYGCIEGGLCRLQYPLTVSIPRAKTQLTLAAPQISFFNRSLNAFKKVGQSFLNFTNKHFFNGFRGIR